MAPMRSLAAVFVAIVGGCAALLPPADTSADTEVPAALVPAGETARLRLAASGVKLYECRRLAGAAPAWLFIGPEAVLFDAAGRKAGRHDTGPSWQALDGSRVEGTVVAKVVPRDHAIPWLLLRAKSTGGPGMLDRVSSVQRLRTEGGNAPEGGCGEATLGRVERMPYRADYVFFEAVRS